MNRNLILLAMLATLSACGDGQPLFDDPGAGGGDGGTGGGGDGDGGVGGDPDLPPGTDSPSVEGGISRVEARNDQGGGFVEDVSYDAASDTFNVDGIAFDGGNVYTREDNAAVSTLSSSEGAATYAVYEASAVVPDDATGVDVDQFQYRAIYGVSSSTTADGEPRTQFAIVRTGSYLEYGFGGFVYERNGGVELPTEGQATYSGDYAGMRVLSGPSGGDDLNYVTGSAQIDIDFEDFNEGSGVKGLIFDRAYTDAEGNPVPQGSGDGELPNTNLVFVVGPGTVTENGEISSGIFSQNEGEIYENGTYYAIVAGDDASEIVGIVVVESDDPRFDDVTAQETGGFIVYRGEGDDVEQ